jgi:trimethylamine:corrinoid methyltransferase-like protein
MTKENLPQLATTMAELEAQGLPVGFSCLSLTQLADEQSVTEMVRSCWNAAAEEWSGRWVMKAIGWLLTGFAVSLGGPSGSIS